MRHFALKALLPGLFCLAAHAADGDEIILNNGNILNGTITAMDSESVTIEISEGMVMTVPRTLIVRADISQQPSGENTGSDSASPSENVSDANGTAVIVPVPLIHLPFSANLRNIGSVVSGEAYIAGGTAEVPSAQELSVTEGENSGSFAAPTPPTAPEAPTVTYPTASGAGNPAVVFGDSPAGEGQSALFSYGDGGYVAVPSDQRINSMDRFSLSFWFMTLSRMRTQFLVSKWDTTNGERADGQFAVCYYQGAIIIYLNDGNGYHHEVMELSVAEIGVWTHITVTFGDGTLILYVNGEAKKRFSINAAALYDNASPITLMSALYRDSDYSRYNLYGGFDDFRLWDQALSAEAAAAVYIETAAGSPG